MIDSGTESAVMRPDDESRRTGLCGPGRIQPVSQSLVHDLLEGSPLSVGLVLQSPQDVLIQGQRRSHAGIMMLANGAVKMLATVVR